MCEMTDLYTFSRSSSTKGIHYNILVEEYADEAFMKVTVAVNQHEKIITEEVYDSETGELDGIL